MTKIAALLSDDVRKKLATISDQKKEVAKADPTKRKENYRRWEWEEIMGQRRDTYTRVGGSIKRK